MAKVPDELYGIPIKEIARRCAVSEKTASRWKTGTACPPQTALWILTGDLGYFAKEWRGWIIRGENLVSPENWCITVNDVLASPLLRSQLAVYQAENRDLKARLESREFAEDQPEPAAESAFLAQALKLIG